MRKLPRGPLLIRYLGESGGSRLMAFVKELELYKDKGVETVNDSNL